MPENYRDALVVAKGVLKKSEAEAEVRRKAAAAIADNQLDAEAFKIRSELEEQANKTDSLPDKRDQIKQISDTVEQIRKMLGDFNVSEANKKELRDVVEDLKNRINVLQQEVGEIEYIDKIGKPHWRSELPPETLKKFADLRNEEEIRLNHEYIKVILDRWQGDEFVRTKIRNIIDGDENVIEEIKRLVFPQNKDVHTMELANTVRERLVEIAIEMLSETNEESNNIYKKAIASLGCSDINKKLEDPTLKHSIDYKQPPDLLHFDSVSNIKDPIDFALSLRGYFFRDSPYGVDSSIMGTAEKINGKLKEYKDTVLPLLQFRIAQARTIEGDFKKSFFKMGEVKKNFDNLVHSVRADFTSKFVTRTTKVDKMINFLQPLLFGDPEMRQDNVDRMINDYGPAAFLEFISKKVDGIMKKIEVIIEKINDAKKAYDDWENTNDGQKLKTNCDIAISLGKIASDQFSDKKSANLYSRNYDFKAKPRW